ncbi:MAG: hypothetical protein ACO3CN_07120, partial [Candidatus Nanopelagicales bacterium]
MGADPVDAITNAIKSGGANYVASQIGAMLPKDFQAVGTNIVGQLIATGKIDLKQIGIEAAQNAAAEYVARETGLSVGTAANLVGAGAAYLTGKDALAAQLLLNTGISAAIDAVASTNNLSTKDKNLLTIAASQAVQIAKTGQFNPLQLVNQLQSLGMDKTNAAKITGETAKDVPISSTAIGAVSIDSKGNLYSADDDGNRIMLSGASVGRTYTPEEWNEIQVGLNTGQAKFVSDLIKNLNNGTIQPDELASELSGAGYSSTQIKQITDANAQYIERGKKANEVIQNYAAVGSDVSTESATQQLLDLGFSQTDAQSFISNIDKQVEARNAYPQTVQKYLAGEASESQLQSAMDAAGIRGDTAND